MEGNHAIKIMIFLTESRNQPIPATDRGWYVGWLIKLSEACIKMAAGV